MPIFYSDDSEKSVSDLSIQNYKDVNFDINPPSPGLGSVFSAGAQAGSEVVSAFTYDKVDSKIEDPYYDVFNQIKGTKYEQFYSDAIGVDNDQDMQAWKNNVDRQLQIYSTLGQAGWKGQVAMMAGSLISPLTFIPFGSQMKAFKALSTAKKIATGAAVTSGLATTQEVLVGEPIKSPEQLITTAIVGAALGGTLGAAIGHLQLGEGNIARSYMRAVIDDKATIKLDVDGGTAGAAWHTENIDAGLAGLGSKPEIPASVVLPTDVLKGPAIKAALSPSPTMQNIGADLFESNWYIGANTKFEPSPTAMETLRNLDRLETVDYHNAMDNLYKQYTVSQNTNPTSVVLGKMRGQSNRAMTEGEFQIEVAKAMRRNDRHAIKEIEESAEMGRQQIKRMNAKMKEAGVDLFQGEELIAKGADSYFTRIFDRFKISRNPAGFISKVRKWLVEKENVDPSEASSMAAEMKDTILGLQDSYPALYLRTKIDPEKGVTFLKHKSWDIPDEIVEEFLLNDARQVVSRYIDQGNRTARWYNYLSAKGVNSERELADNVRADYELAQTKLQTDLETGKITEAEFNSQAKYIQNNLAKDLKNLEDTVAIMLGQYATRTPMDKALQTFRSVNYLSMLGGVVLSSLSDISGAIIKHGMGRTLQKGWLAVMEQIQPELKKLALQDQRRAMVAMEIEIDNSLRYMFDADTTRGVGTALDKLENKATHVFNKATLLSFWVNLAERIAFNTSKSRVLEAAVDYAKLPDAEKVYVAHLGLSSDDMSTIAKELELGHVTRHGQTYIANTDQWANQGLAERFNAALLKDVRGQVVRPGLGNIPAWAQKNEIAKNIMQFKGFFFGFSNKIIINGLQRRDAKIAQGLMALVTLGAVSYALKQTIKGKEIDTSPENLIRQGLSYSGIFGVLTDPAFFAHKSLFGGKTGTRYFNDNLLEYILGPSASRVQDLWELAGDMGHGKLGYKQAIKASKFLPFNNLFYLQGIFNRINGNAEGKI